MIILAAVLILCALGIFSLFMGETDAYTIFFGVYLPIFVIIVIVVYFISIAVKKRAMKKALEKRERAHAEWLLKNELVPDKRFAVLPQFVELCLAREVFVVENSALQFSSIIRCEFITDMTTKSKKDKGVKRAVVGDIRAEGAGADVSASTASKAEKTVMNIRGVTIYTDNIIWPRVDVQAGSEASRDIYNTLLAIIARNKR